MINLFAFLLRGGAAAAKFLLVLFLGYRESTSILSWYAIFTSACVIYIQLAGFEIYQVVGREINSLGRSEVLKQYARHAIVAITAFVFCSFFLVDAKFTLNGESAILCLAIFGLEHFVTELYRYSIFLLRPLRASIIIFMKNAFWVVAFVVAAQLGWIELSVENLVLFWFVGLFFIAILFGFNASVFFILIRAFFDWSAIKSSILLAWQGRLFLVSALSVVAAANLDKIIVSKFFSNDLVASYFLNQTIASIPSLLISFTVGLINWPRCIKIGADGDWEGFSREWLQLVRLYVFVTATSFVFLIIVVLTLKHEFSMLKSVDLKLLIVFVLSFAFVSAAEPFKLKLYVMKKDKRLLVGNLLQMTLSVMAMYVGSQSGSIFQAILCVCFSNLVSAAVFLKWGGLQIGKGYSVEGGN